MRHRRVNGLFARVACFLTSRSDFFEPIYHDAKNISGMDFPWGSVTPIIGRRLTNVFGLQRSCMRESAPPAIPDLHGQARSIGVETW
jgi:hypothetical protein